MSANTKKSQKKEWSPVIRERVGKRATTYQVDSNGGLPDRNKGRKTFKSLGEAEVYADKLKVEYYNYQNNKKKYTQLSEAQKEDAGKAIKICEELGISTLTEALNLLRPHYAPPSGIITLNELRDKFVESYQTKRDGKIISERHYRTLKDRVVYFVRESGWGERLIKEIGARELWDWIWERAKANSWQRNTLKRYCDAVNQLFDYGVNIQNLGDNPMKSHVIKFEMSEALAVAKRDAPIILSVEQAGKLLEIAYNLRNERGMLGFVAIALFVGARTESEVFRMTWEDVDFEEGCVYVRPNKTKNSGSPRWVEICPALLDWLLLCDRSAPLIPKGHLMSWRKIRELAGFRQSGLSKVTSLTRHTFATMSYGLHGDKNKLINEMGHVTNEMLKHYVSVKPGIRKASKLYFGLTPRKVLGIENNVIQMEATG